MNSTFKFALLIKELSFVEMFDSYQTEKNSVESGLSKKVTQGGSHRRVQSNAIPLNVGGPTQPSQPSQQVYSILQGQRIGNSDSRKPLADNFSTPGPKNNVVFARPSTTKGPIGLADIEVYAAKRLKSIMSLQTSLQTNLARFTDMIERLQKEKTKRSITVINHEMSKVIQEIGSSPSYSNKRLQDQVKKLHEIHVELQNRVESEISNKEMNFLFSTNESLAFARITLKICNEFGCQAISLKKKLNTFFDNFDENRGNHQYESMTKTDPKQHNSQNILLS